MTTLNNISWQLTPPVHNGQHAEREIVQHKWHAKKRIVLLPAALLAFSLATPVAASAEETVFNGAICQPVNASRNFVDYNQYGVYNISTTAVATVECSLAAVCPNSDCVFAVHLSLYDRSTTKAVLCTLRKADKTGVITWQQTVSSFGGGPGSGSFGFSFNLTPYPYSGTGVVSLRCSLPPMQSGQASAVTTISVYH